jgi:hypothetical protein
MDFWEDACSDVSNSTLKGRYCKHAVGVNFRSTVRPSDAVLLYARNIFRGVRVPDCPLIPWDDQYLLASSKVHPSCSNTSRTRGDLGICISPCRSVDAIQEHVGPS